MNKKEYIPLFRDYRKGLDWLPDDYYINRYEDSTFRAVADFDEDVDVVGLSFLGGSQKEHTAEIHRLLDENGMNDVVLVVGGIIPPMDVAPLESAGADAVFPSGSDIVEITNTICDLVKKRRRGVKA